jgi:hypothetical protein
VKPWAAWERLIIGLMMVAALLCWSTAAVVALTFRQFAVEARLKGFGSEKLSEIARLEWLSLALLTAFALVVSVCSWRTVVMLRRDGPNRPSA